MARLFGVNIPSEKKLEYALTAIYGIGLSTSRMIIKDLNLDPDMRAGMLSGDDVKRIVDYVKEDSEILVEGDKKRAIKSDIKRYMEIKSYRGMRHYANLPVHGQSSKTNARTRKGPRKGRLKK